MNNPAVLNDSLLNQDDIIRFREGTHYQLYKKMGSLPGKINGITGSFLGNALQNLQKVRVSTLVSKVVGQIPLINE